MPAIHSARESRLGARRTTETAAGGVQKAGKARDDMKRKKKKRKRRRKRKRKGRKRRRRKAEEKQS